MVFRVLRPGISCKGLAQQARERHFSHAGEAMVTSYGHTQCVAHDFLEQDLWLRTATRFHHHGNVHAPVEQRALEVVAGEI
ncbi:MAG: hypothetical protein WA376_01150, partial [Terrimicrobiaceae bacterium]